MQHGIWKCISEFSYSFILKSIVLSCTLGIFTHAPFWNMKKSFKKCFTELSWSFKHKHTLFYNVKISAFVNNHQSHQNISIGSSQTHGGPKVQCLFVSSNLIDKKFSQFFSSKWQAQLPSLLRLSDGYPSDTHSSILASEIPWTEEPGGIQSMWL